MKLFLTVEKGVFLTVEKGDELPSQQAILLVLPTLSWPRRKTFKASMRLSFKKVKAGMGISASFSLPAKNDEKSLSAPSSSRSEADTFSVSSPGPRFRLASARTASERGLPMEMLYVKR
jgi:hypothetical protein